jgi:hypothetical protein
MMSNQSSAFRAGDLVEVCSKEEILKTLDGKGRLDGMPFMPEMFEYCGRRFRVGKAAHKTCDTIKGTGGRGVAAAVHLEGVRCGGRAHDGCQAACTLFWKDAWLKRVDPAAVAEARPESGRTQRFSGCSEADVVAATRGLDIDQAPTYVCQATELFRFSTQLRWWDVRQYVQDYRSGNVDLRTLAMGLAYSASSQLIGLASRRAGLHKVLIAAYDRVQAMRGGAPFPRKVGTIPAGQKTPTCSLKLQPGELVRVRRHKDILETLDTDNKNRGLYFDAEHVPYCGREFRVLAQVSRIVDENTGKMLEFKGSSVVLENVACQSRYSDRRMFCPRAIYPYWREIWLERVNAEPAPVPVAEQRVRTG